MAKPNVGDKIYVPSMVYLSHGADDFQGGSALWQGLAAADKETRVNLREDRGGFR
jgi:hypothetical protein